ncbi:phosphatidate cytidylyltransferase [Nitrospira sp.]|nr:phosphatidate cytidylyltransferase [Nitrospira sp.]
MDHASPSHATTPTGSDAALSKFDVKRVYTGLLLIPTLYVIIRYLPPIACTLLVYLTSGLALHELYRLCFRGRSNHVYVLVGLATTGAWFAECHWQGPSIETLFLGVVAVLLLPMIAGTYRECHAVDSAVTILGIVYIGLGLSYLILLRSLTDGQFLLLFVLLVTFAADTGAYYVGKMLGRHALAASISPNKTIEGLFGGLVLAVTATYIGRSWLPYLDFTLLDAIALGMILTLAGLAGDLVESAIKRSVGAKDSGGLLPGHGGMLDRIDSLLFTGPAFYYYVAFNGIPGL